MANRDIAVVIPTRNRRAVLPRAIESVFLQSHQNFDLVVVDDGSDDGTPSYLASISDARFKWCRFDEGKGGNAARNHGVALSDAPIVSFLDSDDCYLPHRLSEAVDYFASHQAVDVRISSFTSVTDRRSTPQINPEAVFSHSEFERYLVAHCLPLGSSAITIRRRAFDDLGGFDVTLARMQDREFLLRAARAGGSASTEKIDWIKHRSADSLSRRKTGQLDALAALCQRHPVIAQRYSEILRYLVAREIVRPLMRSRLRHAMRAYREARSNPCFELDGFRLLSQYLRGKRKRQELSAELLKRYGARAGVAARSD